jgi:hypothetical protein
MILKRGKLKWTIFAIVFTLFLVGYFFSAKPISNQHLKYIPSSANGVVIINTIELINEFKNLIKEDPTFLLEFSGNKLLENGEHHGINPLTKVAAFKDNLNNHPIFGIVVSITDHKSFDNFFENAQKTEISVNNNITKIYLTKNEHLVTLKINDMGMLIYSSSIRINIDSISEYLKKKVLLNQEIKYNEHENQMLIWNNFNSDSTFLNHLFSEQTSKCNLTPNGLSFQTKLKLKDTAYLKLNTNNTAELGDVEIGKFSMSLANKNSVLFSYIPKELDCIKKHMTGKIWTSITGFNTKDLLYKDSVVINKNYSLPELAIGIEIDSIQELMTKIKIDSSFKNIGDQYEFSINSFLNEKFYLREVNNQIILSSAIIDPKGLSMNFNTLSLNLDFEKTLESYQAKKIYQTFIINSIKKIKPHSFEFNCIKQDQNSIYIDGYISLGMKDEHFIKTLFPMIELLSTTMDF